MRPSLESYEHLAAGKVRDLYSIDEQTMLMVASDRISAFDVVLPTGITDKGLVLNRISSFWFEKTKHIVCTAVPMWRTRT